MGQSLNPLATHDPVPDEVKRDIPQVDYTQCPLENRQTDSEICEDCGNGFGWLCTSTNCDVCGRMLCTRCCPKRYLLHDQPACQACTQEAYRLRRSQMLQEHYAGTGAKGPMSQQPRRGQTILVGKTKQSDAIVAESPADQPPTSHDSTGCSAGPAAERCPATA